MLSLQIDRIFDLVNPAPVNELYTTRKSTGADTAGRDNFAMSQSHPSHASSKTTIKYD